MIVAALYVVANLQRIDSEVRPLPLEPLIGRPLSWDAFGIYPLDADQPLTKAAKGILKDIREAERQRAEDSARYRLNVDGTDLALTCHWIAHFALENYGSDTTSSQEEIHVDGTEVYLDSAQTTGFSIMPAHYYTASSAFTPPDPTNIPGFPIQLKHIGFPTLQNHARDTKDLSWIEESVSITKPVQISGYFVARRFILHTKHSGLMDAWNKKGETTKKELSYWLAGDSFTSTLPVYKRSAGGGV